MSHQSACPQCLRLDVHPVTTPDRIDSISTHPLSRLQRWTGAPLTKCKACRLQFYDWRPVRAAADTELTGTEASQDSN